MLVCGFSVGSFPLALAAAARKATGWAHDLNACRVLGLSLLLGAASLSAQTSRESIDVTLSVSLEDANADFRSVQQAGRRALELAAEGNSVRVLIGPGLYREHVDLVADASLDYAPILFEASRLGSAMLSGSEIWNDWDVTSDSTFAKDYSGPAEVAMVFVEGVRLVRVSSDRPLRMGEFRVYGGRVEFVPPAKAKVLEGTVEVALKLPVPLMRIQNFDTILLSGLYLRQSGGVGLMLERNGHALVEHSTFEHHYDSGVLVAGAHRLRLLNVDTLRNGKDGLVALNVVEMNAVGGSVSVNGFRVSEEGLTAKDSFGMVVKTVQNLVWQNGLCADNRGQGFSILGAESASIERVKALNNVYGGGVLFKVASATLQETVVANNGNLGLTVVDGEATAKWSIFTHNGSAKAAQIMAVLGGVVSLEHCILSTDKPEDPLLVIEGFDNLGLLTKNLYGVSERPFVLNEGSVKLDFETWQAVSGRDLDSAWGDPQFNDPDHFEYIPVGGSIWYEQKDWPVRELTEDEISAARQEHLGYEPTPAPADNEPTEKVQLLPGMPVNVPVDAP